MTGPERSDGAFPGGVFRREALDNYARLDREDAAPSFDPAAMLPRRWALLAGAACLVLLGAAGWSYQVDQGPRGMLIDVDAGSVVVGFTEAIPDLVGESVVLSLADGDRIEGTAVGSRGVNGNGVTGTMLLIEVDSDAEAWARDGDTVTVHRGRTGLLLDIFTDSEGEWS